MRLLLLGLVLVDARHWLTEQSRRHTALLSLLRVPHISLVVNKMDLVGYDEAVVRFADNVDVSRGDLIADVEHSPAVTREITATVCWMAPGALQGRQKLLLKHTTRTVKAIVDALGHRLDVNTLERVGEASELGLNEVGTVALRLAKPLVVDAYRDHRATGSFILIDPASGAIVSAGLISGTHGVEYTI